jgi:hypothetical protein
LEAVPALLTVTSKQLVPLCMLLAELEKVAEPPPDKLLLQLLKPDSNPPLVRICAVPRLANSKLTQVNTSQRNPNVHWRNGELLQSILGCDFKAII